MSVHISSRIWDTIMDNPTTKLVALALADMASDEGICWPSMRSLQRRTGISETQVRSHIRILQAAGILEIEPRKAESGRQTSNLFRILSPIEGEGAAHRTLPAAEGGGCGEPRGGGCGEPRGGGCGEPRGGGCGTPNPWNHKKESSSKPSKEDGNPPPPDFFQDGSLKAPEDDSLPDFPAASMAAAWNRLVPSLAKIQGLAGARARSARARWQDLGSNLADWEAFLQRIEASDFLTGRVPGRDTRRFTATFDWCIIPSNAHKIREGKYDNPKPNTDAHKPTLW